MKDNNTFIDIYSHSNMQIKRKVKSRGSLKSILCFLIFLALFVFTTIAYCLGAYVEINKRNENAFETVGKVQTQSSDTSDYNKISDTIDTVVGIYVYNETNHSYASGVIISQDGYIVTADHIFKDIFSPKIAVYDAQGNYISGAFIGGDKRTDIAVIKVEKTGLKYSDIKSDSAINIGERVFNIGCPMNSSLSKSVTSGILSGIDRRFITESGNKSIKCLQTDAPINPGCSGGGLFNSHGEIIGINCSKVVDESYEGIGFAVPVETVNKVVDEILKYGTVKSRGDLGIKYTAVSYESAIKEKTKCGLIITSINIKSSLYGLGIEKGDIIVSINGKKIYDESVYLDEIEKTNVGETLELTIAANTYKEYKVTATMIDEAGKSNYS